ncbi:uncharacterized protein ATNIH1004_000123 [Aspergillus tanneri]|uniref:GST N-terminal domain-containing protein n=1 Tax=Aspergillus tanneri TaxID=1220188 RepID=A0A5M9MVX9_9EURO|nr:uncharacterized protein ATNIH1004_000123 [Aspergillus tanneri]KAA8651245.1 hypothetical protein ATNIH1004_000123 [Aspergillus tanneri]
MTIIKPLPAHLNSPSPIKIAIAPEYLNVPYEVKQWQFGDDPETGAKSPVFLKLNENDVFLPWKTQTPTDKEQDIVDFEKWEYFLLTTPGLMMGQLNWYGAIGAMMFLKQLEKSSGENILPGKVTAVDYDFELSVSQYAIGGLTLDRYPVIAKWAKTMADREEVKKAYSKIEGSA